MSKTETRLLPCLLFAVALFFSCHQQNNSFREVSDKAMTIQVKKIEEDQGDGASINYAARIIPGKGMIAGNDNVLNTKLIYHMDSCFYVMIGTQKRYAEIVQPIANGVSGSFEYLLTFQTAEMKDGRWDLIYEDKYLSKKIYNIHLNQE